MPVLSEIKGIYVNVTLVDRAGHQNFQSWQHEVALDACLPLQANGSVNYADGVATIRWQTTNETQIAGFYVLRLAADGTWQRLNPDLLAATHSGAATGTSYSFTDSTIGSGASHSYGLEIIGTDGRSERVLLGIVNLAQQLYMPFAWR